MRVVKNFNGDAGWGVIPYIQNTLDRLSDDDSDSVFFNGVEFIDDVTLLLPYKDYKRRVIFAHWSPCEYMTKKDYYYFDAYESFTEVYCVCPFTCNFMNNYYGYEKFIYIPYPFTNYSVDTFYQYDSLVSWFGSIHGDDHIKAIETIEKYSYKFITSQKNTWMHHPYEYTKCTHVALSSSDKLKEVSKTRASLTFNKLYASPQTKYNTGLSSNIHHAFDYMKSYAIAPQFKVRTHEIATCKSLILCKKDPWNLIEDFYEPNKHFIYFENTSELEDILNDVDKNFEKYISIIEAAYEQVQKYSVENIFEFIKTKDNTLINWKNKNYDNI